MEARRTNPVWCLLTQARAGFGIPTDCGEQKQDVEKHKRQQS
jgi:hypothetical protein